MYLKTKHVDKEREEEIFRSQILFCKHVSFVTEKRPRNTDVHLL